MTMSDPNQHYPDPKTAGDPFATGAHAAPGTGGYPPTSSYPAASKTIPAYAPPTTPGYPPAPYGQPGYGQGFAPGYPVQPRNGLGTAGLVCGIIAVVLCWTVYVGVILGILAICFGAVGMGRAKRGEATNRSSAMAGLILGIVAIALLILLLAIGLSVLAGVSTIR
jgi:hypothetical protein